MLVDQLARAVNDNDRLLNKFVGMTQLFSDPFDQRHNFRGQYLCALHGSSFCIKEEPAGLNGLGGSSYAS